ncbi:MAG: 3-oxoacid CoA-transferase subunit B [Desulfobacteria bacterium]
MKKRLSIKSIAKRAVMEFRDGDHVNLGVGIPNFCSLFIPKEMEIILHAEQGVLGYGPLISDEEWEKIDFDYVDAGIRPFTFKPGMCFFDKALSFDMVRGRHIDITVLGALEVSERGDLANWSYGSVEDSGIGGSMDLAVGAKMVIITMEHTTKKGKPKLVKECRYPLTAKECVDIIVTDLAFIEVSREGLLLKEIAPGWSVKEVQALTDCNLIVYDGLKEIDI